MAIAFYAALALQVEDVGRKTVLPVLRVGAGKASVEGGPADQIKGVEYEAGVREQLWGRRRRWRATAPRTRRRGPAPLGGCPAEGPCKRTSEGASWRLTIGKWW
jgi:hypothetical protein